MRIGLALFVLIFATGCVARPADSDAISGEWRMVAIDDDAPAQPARARITIDEEQLSATVGCNGLGGPWRIEENRLIAGPLDGTGRYCTGPVWEQERALNALLVAAPTIAYDDGDLVLKSSRHSARLERVSPPQRES
jgi:heat shock protein HslJ